MADVESILDTTKFMLGIKDTDITFDGPLILDINGVLMLLHQLGVTGDVFSITGNTETWADLLPDGDDQFFAILKPYVYLKVQSIFDPSSSGVVSNSMKSLIEEFETRLIIQVETREP